MLDSHSIRLLRKHLRGWNAVGVLVLTFNLQVNFKHFRRAAIWGWGPACGGLATWNSAATSVTSQRKVWICRSVLLCFREQRSWLVDVLVTGCCSHCAFFRQWTLWLLDVQVSGRFAQWTISFGRFRKLIRRLNLIIVRHFELTYDKTFIFTCCSDLRSILAKASSL